MNDSKAEEQNETEDPKFKRVVGHFLKTPKPHKEITGEREAPSSKKKSIKQSDNRSN